MEDYINITRRDFNKMAGMTMSQLLIGGSAPMPAADLTALAEKTTKALWRLSQGTPNLSDALRPYDPNTHRNNSRPRWTEVENTLQPAAEDFCKALAGEPAIGKLIQSIFAAKAVTQRELLLLQTDAIQKSGQIESQTWHKVRAFHERLKNKCRLSYGEVKELRRELGSIAPRPDKGEYRKFRTPPNLAKKIRMLSEKEDQTIIAALHKMGVPEEMAHSLLEAFHCVTVHLPMDDLQLFRDPEVLLQSVKARLPVMQMPTGYAPNTIRLNDVLENIPQANREPLRTPPSVKSQEENLPDHELSFLIAEHPHFVAALANGAPPQSFVSLLEPLSEGAKRTQSIPSLQQDRR